MAIYDLNDTLRHQPDMKAYFDSLPAFVQHNVYMSSPDIQSLEQLKAIVATMTDRQG